MPPTREDYLNALTNNAATPIPQTNYAPIRGAARRPTPALTPDVLAGVQERLKPWTTGNTDPGGIGGAVMSVLSALDMPRSAIASTIQETVDLFQGEGFSASDWLQQTRQHHGFGDIIADMGIDAGLGGWGNRILGFVGDVATDPLMWLGGMNVYSRARGVKGLIDDVQPRIAELRKLGEPSAELKALEAAVVAASKGKSVSAARNELIRRHGDLGARLVDDLGIDTGLKIRLPGTGPVLGRLSRLDPFIGASSARRASQVPAYTQRRLAESLGDESLENLIRTAARKEAFAEGVDATAQQVARRAAFMPVEFSVPILKGTFGTMQALPGALAGRTAVTRFGQIMGQKLGTPQDNMIAKLARSERVDDVLLANIARRGYLRGDTMASLWNEIGNQVNTRFANNVSRITKDDLLIGRIVLEVSDEEAQAILAGAARNQDGNIVGVSGTGNLSAARAVNLEQKYGLPLWQIALIRQQWAKDVNEPLTQFLLRNDVYSPDGRVSKQFEEVLLSEGGYSPHTLYRDEVGGFQNARALLESIWGNRAEKLPAWVKGILEPDVPYAKVNTAVEARERMSSRHLQERSLKPTFVNSDGVLQLGTKIEIPYKNDPSRTVRFRLRRKIMQPGVEETRFARYMVWGEADPRFNMSTTEQVDWALREAGWLGPNESIYINNYAARHSGYQSSLTRDIRLAVNERYLADQGILINAENFDDYRRVMQVYDDVVKKLDDEVAKLDPKIKSAQEENLVLETVEGGLSHTFRNTRKWRERKAAQVQAKAGQIDEILEPLDDVLGGTAARMFISDLIKTGQISEEGIRALMREAGQSLAESHHLIDELAAIRKELDSVLIRSGLFPPESTIVREADGSFRIYHGLEDPPAAVPVEELLYGAGTTGTMLGQRLDAARKLVPIMDRLLRLSARSDIINEGLERLGSISAGLEQLSGLKGMAVLDDLGAKIAEDIKFVREDLLNDISNKVKQLMGADETVESMETIERFFRGDYSTYYPSRVYRSSGELFDTFAKRLKGRKQKTLGDWFQDGGHNIPQSRRELNTLNKFEGHPRAQELNDIVEDYLQLVKEFPEAKLLIGADFSESSLLSRLGPDVQVANPGMRRPVNVTWNINETILAGKSNLPVEAQRRAVEIAERWTNNTILFHADLSGRTLVADLPVRVQALEILQKLESPTLVSRVATGRGAQPANPNVFDRGLGYGGMYEAGEAAEMAAGQAANVLRRPNVVPEARSALFEGNPVPQLLDIFESPVGKTSKAYGVNSELVYKGGYGEDSLRGYLGFVESRLPLINSAEAAERVWDEVIMPVLFPSHRRIVGPVRPTDIAFEGPFSNDFIRLRRAWEELYGVGRYADGPPETLGRKLDEVPTGRAQQREETLREALRRDKFQESPESLAARATTQRLRENLERALKDVKFKENVERIVINEGQENYSRWRFYGRAGFTTEEGLPLSSTVFSQSDMGATVRGRRLPVTPSAYREMGMVPNQQGGLIRKGNKPDVIPTKEVAVKQPIGKEVFDPEVWVPVFKDLEATINHEYSFGVLGPEMFARAGDDLQNLVNQINVVRNSDGTLINFVEGEVVTPTTSRTAMRQTIDDLFKPERGPVGVRSFEEALNDLPSNATIEDVHNLFKGLEAERVAETAMFTKSGEITSLRPKAKIEDVIELSDIFKALDSKLPAARKAYHATLDRMLGEQTQKLIHLQRQHAALSAQMPTLMTQESAVAKRFAVNQRAALQSIINKEMLETQSLMKAWEATRYHTEEVTRVFAKTEDSIWNINGLGKGDIDLSTLSREGLEDLFNETERMWGPWRIAGDQEFADQVTYVLLAAQKMNDRQQVTGFLKHYDRVHNWMKAQMVATPGFVTRNIMGGMFNMWTEDIPLSVTLRTGRMIQKAYRLGDGDLLAGLRHPKMPQTAEVKNAIELMNVGAHGGGQAASMVEHNLKLDRKLQWIFGTKNGAAKGWRLNLNPMDAQFVMYSSIRHANTFAEEMMRLATGIHAMNIGGTLDDAIDMIYKLHFNYGNLSAFESGAMKRVFPFYTWSRNNLPLQLSQMIANPRRYNRLLSLKRNLEYGTEEEGTVPSYFLEPFGFRLPFSIGGSQVYSVPDLPFQDLLRFDPTGMGFVDAAENILSSGSPMIKVPLEYWGGKQFFKGIPYTGRYQQVPVAWEKIPGLMTALDTIGWAEKNNRGEWKMMDQRIAVMDGLMPYIGRLRRVIPNETRYQERMIQTLASTLGGMNVRVNTPYEQQMQRIRDMLERDEEWQDQEDIRFRQR